MIERILIIVLGVALTYCGIRAQAKVQAAESQTEAWRRLYLQADSDAKYMNCVSLDSNFVVCEKPAHVKDR